MRRQVPLLLVTRHIRFRRIRSGLGGLGTDVATCVAGLVRVIAVEPTNVISCELNIATTSTFAIICVHIPKMPSGMESSSASVAGLGRHAMTRLWGVHRREMVARGISCNVSAISRTCLG